MDTMWRTLPMAWTGMALILICGCASGPLLDNPVFVRPDLSVAAAFVRPDPNIAVDNPVYVPQGPEAYGPVFEKVLDVLDDYFEISYANRYDGRIETFPKIAPGFEQFWRPGNPDAYDRLRATYQTIRQRAIVLIQPADDGGFFVQVTIYKELEDLERPSRSPAGAAAIRAMNTVERQFEVVDPTVVDTKWIPQGQNPCLEQLILQRIKKCM